MKKSLFFLLLLTALAWAPPARANEVTGLRHSSGPGQVRMVIDLAEPPTWQVYTRTSPPRLVVEILDTAPSALKPGTPPTAGVISSWKVEQPTLRRFRWVVNLDAPLPSNRIKTLVLDDPDRLVVDLETTWEDEESYRLTPGVTWLRREVVGGLRAYLLWNELAFDPADPHVSLDVGLGKDRTDSRETVSSMVRRTGALAGINGGFFAASGGALGLVVRGGKVVVPHVDRRPPRTVVGVTRDRRIRFDQVAARGQQLASRGGEDWSDVVVACGAGPRLLHRGQVALTTTEEQLGPKGNDITRIAGRTAVATTAEGQMLMVTASGYRDNHSEGLRLDELASALLRAGGREAMNLDGGASVDMVIRGQVVSDGPGVRTAEKPVGTAMLLFDDRPTTQPDRLTLELAPDRLPADGLARAEVVARVRDASGSPVADGTPVNFQADGGLVVARAATRGGEVRVPLNSLRAPGALRLRARSGYAEATATLRLEAGPLRRLVARLAAPSKPASPAVPTPGPSPAPTRRSVGVDVLAEDGWFNGLSGVPVRVSVDGNPVGSWPTAEDGEVRIPLDLPLQACEVVLVAEGAPEIRLPIPASGL